MKLLLPFVVLCCVCCLQPAFAQTSPSTDQIRVQMRTDFFRLNDQPVPTIDGQLDDAIWQQAPRIDDFHQVRPTDGGAPSQQTEVQVVRSDTYIYVAFRAYDSDVETLTAKGLIQGQNFFSDDRLAVYIDSFNDRRNSYFFQLNANGIRRDALIGTDYFIEDWSTIWYSGAAVHDWGWSAEMAIPIKSIAFDPNADEWGINFGRVYPRNGEEMAWSSSNRNIDPAVAGYIGDVQGFSQGFGLELAPSASLVYREDENGVSDTTVEPSLTTFYNVTPFLTAGLTLNTDFSATDVDDRQVNIGRFSLFFPEKRDFFLRDASIFEFGNIDQNGRPFFSRRIGLSEQGDPLDINAGVKLSGRAGEWNVGALAIHQDVAVDEADQGLFVGRVTRNIGRESEIGAIATHGDPNSSNGNSLIGVDYNYRDSQFLGDQQLRGNLWYQETDTDGFSAKQSAFGAGLNFPNDKYSGYVDYRRIEENFNPALGFVNRSGVEVVDAQARYRHRLDGEFWQWYRTRLQYFRADKLSGGIQSERVFWNVFEGFSSRNDFFTFFVGKTTEGVDEGFDLFGRLPIEPGIYESDRYGVFFETGFQRPFRVEVEIADGDFFGGSRMFIEPEFEWRPNKHFFAALSMRENRIKLPQGEFTSRLFAAKLNYAFNSRWAWLNVVQGDNSSDTISFNSRLRYQPRADREFVLVFNQTRDRNTDEVMDTAIVLRAAINFRL